MKPAVLREELITYALAKPEAYEDHPWGETVVKVRKKVFVFFGTTGSDDAGMGVKLPASQPLALAQAGGVPSGYGLGKAGWVSINSAKRTCRRRCCASGSTRAMRQWRRVSYCRPKRAARSDP